MPAGWKFYRIICLLQTIGSVGLSFHFIFRFLTYFSFGGFMGMILSGLILAQSLFALNVLNKNYPDTPVTGSQKTIFNRLFLLNFLFLSLLFGFIFSEWQVLKSLAVPMAKPVFSLPPILLVLFTLYCLTLIFQLIILYGLFLLRRELYDNFSRKKFEFEK